MIRQAARPTLSSLQTNFCRNKLHKWLSAAIRWHAACLTRSFVSDTRELLWRLAARLRLFVWVLQWGFAGVAAFRWFCRHCDPANRGRMARHRWWRCCSWITHSTLMEPCWISVVVHSPIAATIHQAEAQPDNVFFNFFKKKLYLFFLEEEIFLIIWSDARSFFPSFFHKLLARPIARLVFLKMCFRKF